MKHNSLLLLALLAFILSGCSTYIKTSVIKASEGAKILKGATTIIIDNPNSMDS